MKVALLAPSSVPFVWGGAENIWRGIWIQLNQTPGVIAEMIKLPSPEQDFWSIISSYKHFSELNLDHFDRVITTKYPAWMVEHRDHVVYMQHTLRGLYDTYPAHLSKQDPELRERYGALFALLDEPAPDRISLKSCFDELDRLKQAGVLLPEHCSLPGQLLRRVVHFFDRVALRPSGISRYMAIAHEVAGREYYFPQNVQIDVAYHPSALAVSPSENDAAGMHIFTASRLDAPKRLDLLIKAYRKAGLKIPLRIAGTGPQAAELESLIAGDPSIELLGHVSEVQLAQEYAKALFVPFIPEKEDFGLIGFEAMRAAKPVLTCTDSGGIVELVEDGKNGRIVEPTLQAIAGALADLSNVSVSEEMGRNASLTVAGITWQGLAENLLAPAQRHSSRRLTVLNTFPVFPPVSGGQARLFNLYRELARLGFEVHLINLAPSAKVSSRRRLAPGLFETLVPVGVDFLRLCEEEERRLGVSCVDWVAARHPDMLPEWRKAIELALEQGGQFICSHPYSLPVFLLAGGEKWIYEAHNVEADLKAAMYKNQPDVAERIAALEAQAYRDAEMVISCSDGDAERFVQLYSAKSDPERVVVIANGADTERVKMTSLGARKEKLRSLQMSIAPEKIALFMGSHHGPNIEAAFHVLAAARKCEDTYFIVLGSVKDALAAEELPANVRCLGVVDDAEKCLWLEIAGVALNPMDGGSGSNLKVIEYAAAGIPIVSTSFGVRGTALSPDKDYIAISSEELAKGVRAVQALSARDWENMTASARSCIAATLSWSSLGRAYADALLVH
ncbi:glycosyltransferase family 4 protein [Chitinilyticum litopenaei]|uniref:glycosyltransferase family 4 protein n=1 Tax=Chitinilyticum litopenaei TaxID=1121276 RepID=UPI00040A7EFB|nr:glycosyltransferase [Chitinilyticum litopenaei]